MRFFTSTLFSVFISTIVFSQSQKVNYSNIYKLGLDADIKSVLPIVESYDSLQLIEKDAFFVNQFKERFMSDLDNSDYLKNHDSKINNLHLIYRDYWRESLLSNQNNDSLLFDNLANFLKKDYPNVTSNEDTLDVYFTKYIKSKGYYTTGLGRVGKLYDLLVWKAEKDTVYHIKNKVLNSKVRIVFMTDFVSLGWEEYATFGKYYPGGWAKTDRLFCVEDSYDLNSEKFKVSYLANEGQHFSDYKKFPNLTSYELEYRAKLVELALADERLLHLIEFYINNSNKESRNGHSKANYYVIANLSEQLFAIDFENNIEKWEQVGKTKINKTALELLKTNTKSLKKKCSNKTTN